MSEPTVDDLDGDLAEYLTVPAGDLQPGMYLIGTDAELDADTDEELDADLESDDDDELDVRHISEGAPRLVYSVQSDDFWTRVELADLRASQIYEERHAQHPQQNTEPKRFTSVEAFGSTELVYVLRITRGDSATRL